MDGSIVCSIIIVYYDGFDKLQRCLNSISNHSPAYTEVIIVNNSTQLCNFVLRDRKFIVIGDGQNYGYSKGNNIGLSSAHGKYILLLNPDTELTDNFIENAILVLEKQPNIVAIGPKLIDDHNNIQTSAFNFPSLKRYLLHDILFVKGKYDINERNQDSDQPLITTQLIKCNWLCGAAVMLRRKDLIRINGFDARYFLYFEDIDLFKKIKEIGGDVMYCPMYVVKHSDKNENGIFSDKFNSARRITAYDFSMMQYWHKHKPELLPIVRFLIFIRSLSRLVVWSLLPSLKRYAGKCSVNERRKGYLKSLCISVYR
ncbi:MAG: glycosyltransferase family 2 protein [Candidatus Edwardsbacteria bacterium]|nr:glycosyltransferase family 2 protein [Candidatus Edwardsbacteria bacterium]MBU1577659.1 glycosyltransferase family 2 protein [Candidatus Edwardsbacteria bacterium]MBU2593892.1 glycosyltransferase family 2 protein [Candidatus Edwardsbacteria bacterium]